ncbi:MAG: hypothetical protein ACLFMO_01060 [Eubacteriales bacterium]
MRLGLIQAFIILIAGLITCIISIINKIKLIDSLFLLLVVLIIFFFIGFLTRKSLKKIITQKKPKEQKVSPIDTKENNEELKNDNDKIDKT